MAYYWTCPECGSNLDPGEKCSDCENNYKEDFKYEYKNKQTRDRECKTY